MKTVKNLEVGERRVFVRCDFNVPLRQGEILDDFRIKKAVPTLEYLIEKGAKLILASHLGRPGGKKDPSLSLSPVQERLLEFLDRSVVKADRCIGKKIEKWTQKMKEGEVLLLENLRFRKGERKNDKRFSRRLSRLADLYVNEAFSVSHRRHASLVGVPEFLPGGAGFVFEKEVEALSRVFGKGKKPVTGIIGGDKVESKSRALTPLSDKADCLLLGGKVAQELEGKEKFGKEKIVFPVDGKKEEGKVLDIGPETIDLFKEKIGKAGTVFWAGPLGKFEKEGFEKGTLEIAKAVVKSGAFKVVGGGDTVSFLREQGLASGFDHVSTGGGAMLYYLARGTLPALKGVR